MNKPKKRYLIYDVTNSLDGFCNEQLYTKKAIRDFLKKHYSDLEIDNAISNDLPLIADNNRIYKIYTETIA